MEHNVLIKNERYTGINPLIFGYDDCLKSHSFGPAVRSYWLVHYITSGCGIFKINGKEYSLGQGEMFVIPPYVETYYEADSKDPWSYIWIGFTSGLDLPAKLPDTAFLPDGIHIFNAMKLCEKKENSRSAFLCSKLWELFSLLLDYETKKPNLVEQALDCIHSEYMNDISVSRIAKRLNIDRTYFSCLFKKEVGISPGKYLHDYKMNAAASLLLNKSNSVSVVATSVGYSDIFNFSKMFKRHFGKSPSKYIADHSHPFS